MLITADRPPPIRLRHSRRQLLLGFECCGTVRRRNAVVSRLARHRGSPCLQPRPCGGAGRGCTTTEAGNDHRQRGRPSILPDRRLGHNSTHDGRSPPPPRSLARVPVATPVTAAQAGITLQGTRRCGARRSPAGRYSEIRACHAPVCKRERLAKAAAQTAGRD